MYYIRIQQALGKDLEFHGALGQCIKFLIISMSMKYAGHFILKVL